MGTAGRRTDYPESAGGVESETQFTPTRARAPGGAEVIHPSRGGQLRQQSMTAQIEVSMPPPLPLSFAETARLLLPWLDVVPLSGH
jgi:hypothetical protein